MKYSESLKDLWKAVAKYDSRYMLQAIKIDAEKKVAVATDGHMLVVADIESLLEPDEKSFLLPVDALRAARTLWLEEKKRDRSKLKKNMRSVLMRSTDDVVTVLIGSSKRGQTFEPMVGTYPKWEEVLPKSTSDYKTSITISLRLLSSLAESMLGNYKRDDAVCISVSSPDKAALVTVNSDNRSYGMLMPMRADGMNLKPKQFWNERKPA